MNKNIFSISLIKKFPFWIVTIILSCVIAFAIAEIAIRIFSPQMTGPVQFAYSPQLGSIPVPDQCARRTFPGVYDYTYCNNSLGLRGNREYSEGKSVKRRILISGDSMSYGIGVNDNQTFCYKIEEGLLDKNLPVEVINAGNGGAGTDYSLKFFKTLGYKFQPDLTVLCFFCNDFYDNLRNDYYTVDGKGELSEIKRPFSNSIVKRKDFLRESFVYNWLSKHSHLVNLLKKLAVKVISKWEDSRKGRYSQTVIHYPDNLYEYLTDNDKKVTETFIRHLKKAVRDSGSGFMVFYIPAQDEIEQYRRIGKTSNAEASLTKILKLNDEAVLSLTPILAESKIDINKLYYPREGHLTARAHYIVANFMSHYIEKYIREKKL